MSFRELTFSLFLSCLHVFCFINLFPLYCWVYFTFSPLTFILSFLINAWQAVVFR